MSEYERLPLGSVVTSLAYGEAFLKHCQEERRLLDRMIERQLYGPPEGTHATQSSETTASEGTV